MYSPLIGQFAQRDPLGYAAGDANLLRYCGNQAVNATDPMGTWTRKLYWVDGKALAIADYECEPLADLAEAITGKRADWKAFGLPDAVTKGQQVDVQPLFDLLEKRLRENIILAARAPKFAHFPEKLEAFEPGTGLDDAGVNRFFTEGDRAVDCLGMVRIVMARGLILTLGEFDRPLNLRDLSYTTSVRMPIYQRAVPSIADVKLGDWVRFSNVKKFRGPMNGQHTIKVGEDLFWGWTGENTELSENGWNGLLLEAYNEGKEDNKKIEAVPGYSSERVRFFMIPKLAMDIFDVQTKRRS